MKWTQNKPTQPGYYWYKVTEKAPPEIIKIYTERSFWRGEEVRFSSFDGALVTDWPYWWLGPIKPLEEQ